VIHPFESGYQLMHDNSGVVSASRLDVCGLPAFVQLDAPGIVLDQPVIVNVYGRYVTCMFPTAQRNLNPGICHAWHSINSEVGMATFEENVKIWEAIVEKAKLGAAPTATAMARFIAERTASDTLARSSHGSGAYHRTRPFEPPARSTGKLAKGMYYKAAFGSGNRKTAWVGNRVDYSRILELGCRILPANDEFVHWKDSGGSWFHEFLDSPPHPFLEPTVDESVDDGSLRDVAIEAITPYDP
jgi:hypothetical protein